MRELIPIEIQLSAVVLAEKLSFSAATEKLGTSAETLHARINELATRLACELFRVEGDVVEVTKDGQVVIEAFRIFLMQNGKLLE